MLDATNRRTLDLSPVDALIQGFIDQADDTDVISTDNVEAQRCLLAGLIIVWLTYNALHCILKDLLQGSVKGRHGEKYKAKRGDAYKIGLVVSTEQSADEGAAIGGDDADLL